MTKTPISGRPEAHLYDATHSSALQGAAADEAQALDRIARWHGPGELEAALLALVPETRGADDWRSWATATVHLRVADAIRHEIERLGPVGRQRAFEQLARAEAKAPLEHRRAVLAGTRRRIATPVDALRWLALRHLLGARPRRLPMPGPRATLEALDNELRVASRWMGLDATPPMPDAKHAWRAAVRLRRRLSAMQRPLLLHQWRAAGAAPELIASLALLLDLELPRAPG